MNIKITQLFPDLLNLYGDSGNIEVLRHRLQWRGIDVKINEHTKDMTELDLSDTDILFIGGGGEAEERIVASRLGEYRDIIKDYIDRNKTLIAVCGGFMLLGKYYADGDEKIPGADILDIYTEKSEQRFVGDTVIKSDIVGTTIVGFTNHGGYTHTENYDNLGEAISGYGNGTENKGEGIIYKNVYGTYLHGPLFPKNPKLCDYILRETLREKYADFTELAPLDDSLEEKAHQFILDRSE